MLFLAFLVCFLILDFEHIAGYLIVFIYRGVFMEDGDGLDAMFLKATNWQMADKVKSMTGIVCAIVVDMIFLNLMIAVLSNEYNSIERDRWLHFHAERADTCSMYLLGTQKIKRTRDRDVSDAGLAFAHSLVYFAVVLIGFICVLWMLGTAETTPLGIFVIPVTVLFAFIQMTWLAIIAESEWFPGTCKRNNSAFPILLAAIWTLAVFLLFAALLQGDKTAALENNIHGSPVWSLVDWNIYRTTLITALAGALISNPRARYCCGFSLGGMCIGVLVAIMYVKYALHTDDPQMYRRHVTSYGLVGALTGAIFSITMIKRPKGSAPQEIRAKIVECIMSKGAFGLALGLLVAFPFWCCVGSSKANEATNGAIHGNLLGGSIATSGAIYGGILGGCIAFLLSIRFDWCCDGFRRFVGMMATQTAPNAILGAFLGVMLGAFTACGLGHRDFMRVGALLGVYLGALHESSATQVLFKATAYAFVFGGVALGFETDSESTMFALAPSLTMIVAFLTISIVSSFLTDDVAWELLLAAKDLIGKTSANGGLTSKPEALEGPPEEHFLWLCYRADYTIDHFINQEVEKEHLRDVRKDLLHMRQTDMLTLQAKMNAEAEKYHTACEKLTRRVEATADTLVHTAKVLEETLDNKLDEIMRAVQGTSTPLEQDVE